MKSETRTHVEYWNPERAAIYLGYTHTIVQDGVVIQTANLTAFRAFLYRCKPKVHWIAGRKRFRQIDLDRCVEAPQEERQLSLVRGGKR